MVYYRAHGKSCQMWTCLSKVVEYSKRVASHYKGILDGDYALSMTFQLILGLLAYFSLIGKYTSNFFQDVILCLTK